MKKIISLIIISLFFSFSGTNVSSAKISNSNKTLIDNFITNYTKKLSNKYNTQEKKNEKINKIIDKIEVLKINFENRKNLKNKTQLLEFLKYIKSRLSSYLNIQEQEEIIESTYKDINGNIVTSKVAQLGDGARANLENLSKKLNVPSGGKEVYFLRLFQNSFDLNDPDSEVYLKKAVLDKDGKEVDFVFLGMVGKFNGSDLFEIKYGTEIPEYCYDRKAKYRGTEFDGMSESLAFASNSLEGLIKRVKNEKKWRYALNKTNPQINKGDTLCATSGNAFVEFEARDGLVEKLEKYKILEDNQ